MLTNTHKLIFATARSNQMCAVLAVIWVTDGMESCIVGYVDPRLEALADQLEGRLVQATDIFLMSSSPTRTQFSDKNKGVCLMAIIDSYRQNDDRVTELYDYPDSEEEEVESVE